MSRLALLWLVPAAAVLAVFGVVVALDVPLFVDPAPWMDGGIGAAAAGVGLALLWADVLLPVPSSIVMVLHGRVFGFVGGMALNLVGQVGATMIAWWLGRRGGPLVGRLLGPTDRERAQAWAARWGDLAVVLSRPIPVAAETVALVVGASGTPALRVLMAAVAGSMPAAVVYALAGAYEYEHSAAVVVAFVAVAGSAWWLSLRWRARPESTPEGNGLPLGPQ